MIEQNGLNKKGYPLEQGIYLAKGVFGSEDPQEIDVYKNKYGTLCCWCEDFTGPGTKNKEYDLEGHVPIRKTGLEFIKRVRELH